MKRKKVLVVGELNVDLILNKLKSDVVSGKETIAEKMDITMGSSSAIFACNLAALGTDVSFCGKLGDDSMGKTVLDALCAKSVKTEHIIISETWETGITVAINQGNNRAMVTYPGAMLLLTQNDILDEVLKHFDHLHVSSIFLQTGLKHGLVTLLQRAKSFGLTTSVDPQFDPDEKWDVDLSAMLPWTDIFLPNETESYGLTHMNNMQEVIQFFKTSTNTVVIKCGEEGSWLVRGGNAHFQHAYKSQSFVDSIGAGDSFDAGFIYGFLENKTMADSQKWATAMGCLNTSAAGGTTAFSHDKDALFTTLNNLIGTKN